MVIDESIPKRRLFRPDFWSSQENRIHGQNNANFGGKPRLPELVSRVEEREDEIVVTRNGKPAAVLINSDEYERLKETLDVLSDPVSMRQIAQSKRFYAKQQQGESFEAIFGEPLIR